jgi:hypothetical protein
MSRNTYEIAPDHSELDILGSLFLLKFLLQIRRLRFKPSKRSPVRASIRDDLERWLRRTYHIRELSAGMTGRAIKLCADRYFTAHAELIWANFVQVRQPFPFPIRALSLLQAAQGIACAPIPVRPLQAQIPALRDDSPRQWTISFVHSPPCDVVRVVRPKPLPPTACIHNPACRDRTQLPRYSDGARSRQALR